MEIREEGSKGKLIREFSLPDEKVKVDEKKDYSVIMKGLRIGEYRVTIRAEYSKPEYGGTKVAMTEALLEVIEKELIIEGKITEFSIEVNETGNKIKSKISFKNIGNTEFNVEGLIELKNDQGRTVGQIPVNETSILAGKEKRIEELWEGSLPAGLYEAELVLIYGEGEMVSKEIYFTIE